MIALYFLLELCLLTGGLAFENPKPSRPTEPACPALLQGELTEQQCLGNQATCDQPSFKCVQSVAPVGNAAVITDAFAKENMENCQKAAIIGAKKEAVVFKTLGFSQGAICYALTEAPADVDVVSVAAYQLCVPECQEASTTPTLVTTTQRQDTTTASPITTVAPTTPVADTHTDPCVPHPCFEGSCHNGTCDFCNPNQCDGGSCINKTSKWDDEIFNFTCVCNEGYGGPYCRLSDDPCNAEPKPQCKNQGTCRVKIKPGKNDWFCECPGKPVIGQAKDCSTTDPDDVKYPIPAVVMKTVISVPIGAIVIACAVFGAYECLRTGELPTLTWARIASRLTITTWTKNRIDEPTETTSPETSAKNVNISIKSETASQSKDSAPVEDETLVKSQSFRDKTSLFNNLKQKLSVMQRVKTQIF